MSRSTFDLDIQGSYGPTLAASRPSPLRILKRYRPTSSPSPLLPVFATFTVD